MRRGTTPILTFFCPFNAKETVKDLRVSFAQGGETVLEKKLADCTLDGGKIIVELSQEDTLKFAPDKVIQIQVKFADVYGKVTASKDIYKLCDEILNEEIL